LAGCFQWRERAMRKAGWRWKGKGLWRNEKHRARLGSFSMENDMSREYIINLKKTCWNSYTEEITGANHVCEQILEIVNWDCGPHIKFKNMNLPFLSY